MDENFANLVNQATSQRSLLTAKESLTSFTEACAEVSVSQLIVAVTDAEVFSSDYLQAIGKAVWGYGGTCIHYLGGMNLDKTPGLDGPVHFNLLLLGSGTDFSALCEHYNRLATEAGAILLKGIRPRFVAGPASSLNQIWTAHVFSGLFGTNAVHKIPDLSPETFVFNPFTASIAFWRALLEHEESSEEIQRTKTGEPSHSDAPSRPCEQRDLLWLEWRKEIGAESRNVFGRIRDKWNSLADAERAKYAPCHGKIAKGKGGYDIVRKALNSTKRDGGNP
jgi:hypothetical protein